MTDHTQHGWEDKTPDQQQDFVSTPNLARTDKDLIIKDFYTFNNIEFNNKKGQKVGYTKVFTTYTALTTDYYLGCVQTSTMTLQLPPITIVGKGKKYTIKDESGTAATNIITVNGYNSELFDGASSTQISTNYGSITVISSDSYWNLI